MTAKEKLDNVYQSLITCANVIAYNRTIFPASLDENLTERRTTLKIEEIFMKVVHQINSIEFFRENTPGLK